MISIPQLNLKVAMEAFRLGLGMDDPLYRELTMCPRQDFEAVQAKTMAFIRLEEDREARRSLLGWDRVERRGTDQRDQPCSHSLK